MVPSLNQDCLKLVFERLLDEPFTSLNSSLSLHHYLTIQKTLYSCSLVCKSWSHLALIPLCRRVIIRYDAKDFDCWIQNANTIYNGQMKDLVKEVVIVGGRRIISFRSARRIDLTILTNIFPNFYRLIVHSTIGLAFIEDNVTNQITDVVFCDNASDGFLALFSLPTFQSLRHLEIGSNGHYDDRLEYSTRDTTLDGLETLILRDSRLGLNALRFVLQGCNPDKRISLYLYGRFWNAFPSARSRLFADQVKALHLDPIASLWFLNSRSSWNTIAPLLRRYCKYDPETGTEAAPTTTSVLFDHLEDLYLTLEDPEHLEFISGVSLELKRLRIKRIFASLPNTTSSNKAIQEIGNHLDDATLELIDDTPF